MSKEALAESMRNALRRFAKGVAIVTTCTVDHGHMAMAATAVCELSLDPPAMLVCVHRGRAIHGALSAGAPFCINILHASQRNVSSACGGGLPGAERFDVGNWHETDLGVRRLVDAQASFLCSQATRSTFGTHSIVVGKVREVFLGCDLDPLVYVDGRYRTLATAQGADQV